MAHAMLYVALLLYSGQYCCLIYMIVCSKPRSRVASKDAETQCDICGHGGGEDSETIGANKDNSLKDDGVTSNLREEVLQTRTFIKILRYPGLK